MAKKGIYRGFSSYEYQRSKTFKLSDVGLVKMDLLNHIFTRRGERVMMPLFGTRIPDLAFEPLDEELLVIIEDDLRQVIAFDPRVSLMELKMEPLYDENRVVVSVKLLYVELGVIDNMDINISFESV